MKCIDRFIVGGIITNYRINNIRALACTFYFLYEFHCIPPHNKKSSHHLTRVENVI
nr:MAG TPA: hypothetical protein [Caudoviricetes sp.]